ncbi:MAG: hypothetical protein KKF46_01265 [Nanoarchaeota archaeon]|nr:hypothetical protein [Nanoarchaeota archaeon]MBU1320963.1 hypothetical protein [Nanoarchaeota archaeon]MBU1598348.1 hypothetical protein [Nanoarchaeota archaeon]MBU2441750.1 hypothetical protein [Nanoarchaeota archaeon]
MIKPETPEEKEAEKIRDYLIDYMNEKTMPFHIPNIDTGTIKDMREYFSKHPKHDNTRDEEFFLSLEHTLHFPVFYIDALREYFSKDQKPQK